MTDDVNDEHNSDMEQYDPQDAVDVAEEEYEAAHFLLGTPDNEPVRANDHSTTTAHAQEATAEATRYVHVNATHGTSPVHASGDASPALAGQSTPNSPP